MLPQVGLVPPMSSGPGSSGSVRKLFLRVVPRRVNWLSPLAPPGKMPPPPLTAVLSATQLSLILAVEPVMYAPPPHCGGQVGIGCGQDEIDGAEGARGAHIRSVQGPSRSRGVGT